MWSVSEIVEVVGNAVGDGTSAGREGVKLNILVDESII